MTNANQGNVDHYAVFGNPIAHSKSPLIHSLFAQQTKQNIHYEAVLVTLEKFNTAVSEFANNGGKGINITVPFKLDAWKIATQLTDRATRAGAVNTISINGEGNYLADNTDGIGLVRDLSINHQLDLTDKSILMIGAGGAVRGTLQPLLEKNPASIFIANRTKEKATLLASDFSDLGNIHGLGLNELSDINADIIINGTSASLNGELPDLPDSLINKNTFCYDMMYASKPTIFMQWGIKNNTAHVCDGLGMLVEQAAESFTIWRGITPTTKPVIQSIRNTLS